MKHSAPPSEQPKAQSQGHVTGQSSLRNTLDLCLARLRVALLGFLVGWNRLFLRRLRSPWRSERRREADKREENEDWKKAVEQGPLPVEIHGSAHLRAPAGGSSVLQGKIEVF